MLDASTTAMAMRICVMGGRVACAALHPATDMARDTLAFADGEDPYVDA